MRTILIIFISLWGLYYYYFSSLLFFVVCYVGIEINRGWLCNCTQSVQMFTFTLPFCHISNSFLTYINYTQSFKIFTYNQTDCGISINPVCFSVIVHSYMCVNLLVVLRFLHFTFVFFSHKEVLSGLHTLTEWTL